MVAKYEVRIDLNSITYEIEAVIEMLKEGAK